MTTQLLIKPEEQAQLTGKQIPFSQILIIDFGHALSGDSAQCRTVAGEIGVACRDAGFFYIKSYGIEPRVLDAVYAQGEKFFALSAEENRVVRRRKNEDLHRHQRPQSRLFADARRKAVEERRPERIVRFSFGTA